MSVLHHTFTSERELLYMFSNHIGNQILRSPALTFIEI